MKKTALLLAFVLLFSFAACARGGGGQAEGEAEKTYVQPDDFSVKLNNGKTFTLSKELKKGRPVLINLWATWCGYCVKEFPYLQAVYEKNKDALTVVALSVEPQDTAEVIAGFAEERGFTFPMGSAVGTGLERYAQGGIPVTLVVDKAGNLVKSVLGAARSEEEMFSIVKDYIAADYAPAETCVYSVYCVDADTNETVNGCTVSFCTEDTCVPVEIPDGFLEYEAPAAHYTVKTVSLPEGWVLAPESPAEIEVEPYAQNVIFYLIRE